MFTTELGVRLARDPLGWSLKVNRVRCIIISTHWLKGTNLLNSQTVAIKFVGSLTASVSTSDCGLPQTPHRNPESLMLLNWETNVDPTGFCQDAVRTWCFLLGVYCADTWFTLQRASLKYTTSAKRACTTSLLLTYLGRVWRICLICVGESLASKPRVWLLSKWFVYVSAAMNMLTKTYLVVTSRNDSHEEPDIPGYQTW